MSHKHNGNHSKIHQHGAYDKDCEDECAKHLDSSTVAEMPALEVDDSELPDRNLCDSIRPSEKIEYRFSYRNMKPLREVVQKSIIDSLLTSGDLKLGCVGIKNISFLYTDDFRFEQVWSLSDTVIGDLSSVVALAPAEETLISIKKTQRTTLTRNVVESNESMTNSESTQIDKEVLNVARSVTKSQQWHIDSTASINIGSVGSLSVTAGYGESTSSTSNRSLQRIVEATQKSTEQLKTLQKTEVTQSNEFVNESIARRKIKNPYNDRSLMFNIYDLYKKYQVTSGLVEIRPSLVMEVSNISFDRDFVLGNSDYLSEILLDSSLLNELQSALQTVQRPYGSFDEDEARALAKKALYYLFEEPVVIGDPAAGINFDIVESLNSTGNALDDAVGNNLGDVYTTLIYYYRLYSNMTSEDKSKWAIRIAVALSDSIQPSLSSIDPSNLVNILDRHNPTEVMRRLSGYISLVEKILKPQLEPMDDARLAMDAIERAEYVIGRIIKHMSCYKDFYLDRYLEYINAKTQSVTIKRLFFDLLSSTGREDLLDQFDPAMGFLEGHRFVVPLKVSLSIDDAIRWSESLRGVKGGGKDFNVPDPLVHVALLPADGVYIEPYTGSCVLEDVPEVAQALCADFKLSSGDQCASEG